LSLSLDISYYNAFDQKIDKL